MGNFDLTTIFALVKVALPIVVSYVAAHVVQYKRYSNKFSQFRAVVDDIDDKNKDPNVTQEQFDKFIADSKALIS